MTQYNQQTHSQAPGSYTIPNRYYAHRIQPRNGYSHHDYDNDYDERHAVEQAESQTFNVYQRQPLGGQPRHGRPGREWQVRQQYHRTGLAESVGREGTAIQEGKGPPESQDIVEYGAGYRSCPPGAHRQRSEQHIFHIPHVQHNFATAESQNNSERLPPTFGQNAHQSLVGGSQHLKSGQPPSLKMRHTRESSLKQSKQTLCMPETCPNDAYQISARQPLLPTLVPVATSWDNPFPVLPSKTRPPGVGERRGDGAKNTSHSSSSAPKTHATTSYWGTAIANGNQNPPGELQVLSQSYNNGPPSPFQTAGNPEENLEPGSARYNQTSPQAQGGPAQQQAGITVRESVLERPAILNYPMEEYSVLHSVRGKARQTPARIDPAQSGETPCHPPSQDSSAVPAHYSQNACMKSLYYLDQHTNLSRATSDSHNQGVQAHNIPHIIPRHAAVASEHRQDSYDERGNPYRIPHNGPPSAIDTPALARTALKSMATETVYHAPDPHSHIAYGNALVEEPSSLHTERLILDRSGLHPPDPRACAPSKYQYAPDLYGQYSGYGHPDSVQSQRHVDLWNKRLTPGAYDSHPRRNFSDQHERVRQHSEAEAFRLLPMQKSAHLTCLHKEVLAESGEVAGRPKTAPPGVDNYGSLAQYSLPVPQEVPAAAQTVGRPSRALHDIGLADGSRPDTLPQHPTPVRVGLIQGNVPPQSNKPRAIWEPSTNYGVLQGAKQRQLSSASLASSERQDPLPVTHEELERLRTIVKSNPSDFKSQLLLAKKMVEAASVLAEDAGRADPKARNRNREKYIFDAHKLVKKLVSRGYAEATFYLADCYSQGLLGLEVDVKEAFSLYQSAAKAGHPTSAFRTAVCCEMGPEEGGGTRKDPLKAVKWYKYGASLGNTPAMFKMGMILLKGLLGQQKNPSEAVSWLKRAAERADEENPHALHELGILYESATPTDKLLRDEAYALQLFKQAADLNYKYSQCRLGQAYEYGQLGCAIDARSSITWYSRAAAQSEHQAELALSGFYLTGSEGILEHSDTEAYLWARKAACAEPPLPKAMFAMGYYTEIGIGCPRSLEEAKRWYGRAASYKLPEAQERLEELKKGGTKVQKHREKLTRNNQKQHDAECKLM